MAGPKAKRQKVEHIASDDDDDDDEAPFASFDETGSEDVEDEHVGIVAPDGASDEEMEDTEGGSQKGKQEQQSGSAKKSDGTSKPVVQEKRNKNTKSKPSVDMVSGAYAAGSFKSNVFKLQVDELLDQIRPRRGKREEAAEQTLHTIKKTVDAIQPRKPLAIDDAERQLLKMNKVAIPFPEPRPPRDAKYKLEYQPPAHVNVVGSYALRTASRATPELSIDMTITMPSELFQEKDYLNYRYFYKRAYYLGCLAAGLKEDLAEKAVMRFVNWQGDHLKPILTVTPAVDDADDASSKTKSKWRINIIPCLASHAFSKDKLLPSKNCIRASDAKDAAQSPTPFYNSSLRADMLVTAYLKSLHSATASASALKDACLLGSTWLRQRGLDTSIAGGGFGSFEWAAMTALLLQGGGPGGRSVLSSGYSSYQMFKAILQVLALKDISKQPLIVGAGDNDMNGALQGQPAVWDSLNGHNILYKMTASSYAHLRAEARATLQTLNDSKLDGFEPTFILRSDSPLLRSDHVMELPAASLVNVKGTAAELVPACKKLYDILRRGLGDRASDIAIRLPHSNAWKVGTARPLSIPSSAKVTLGLTVRSENVARTVDHGPSADNKREAASFREFWGDKAELRRFKDGSIQESLVWDSPHGGQSVLEQIVRHLLRRHFSSSVEQSLTFHGDECQRVLRQTTALSAFQPVMEAFKTLENDIRGLTNLPLSIRHIVPTDSQLRYTSTEIPLAASSKQRAVPADTVIQFEGSARWPDDLEAIQRTKIAFLANLADSLEGSVDGLACRLGLENEMQSLLNQGFLEVIYETGVAFRLRIHHDRELTLLERRLKDKSLNQTARETAALGLASYKRLYVKTPAHTQAIVRLCNRFAALSGAIRLTKKWFASHLLANHIMEEVIETIVARTFLQPGPWEAPNSVQTGFLRTLHWLSRWDWKAEPLIVDLSGDDLKQADAQSIQTRFEAWRKLDPNMNRVVLFAATNVDQDGTSWTEGHPAKVVAGRMTALAKAARAEIEAKGLDLDPAALFVSPLSDFDFVLHLNAATADLKRRSSGANNGFKNLELAELEDDSLVGYTPAQFLLDELKRTYNECMVLFSGLGQRPVIAGLWNPQTAPRSWRMNLDYSTVPTESQEEVQAVLNKEAILSEIAHLGGDLIEKIEVNRP